MNPVPIAPTFGDEVAMTAVNLGGSVDTSEKNNETIKSTDDYSSPHTEKVSAFVEQLRQIKTTTEKLDWGLYDIANQVFDAMQSTTARQKLASYPPDHTIEIVRETQVS